MRHYVDAQVPNRVSPNIATVTFEIMVDRLDLVLMRSGPEDNMNLVEGDMPHANGTPASAMLTVTANQMVAEDIEVMIMRDRSKSSAGEDEVGMITIEADSESGKTMVMAVEDDMPEDMEELVLYAMAGDMEVEGGGDALPLGRYGPGPADHRAAPAGGPHGGRRVPAVPSAVGRVRRNRSP